MAITDLRMNQMNEVIVRITDSIGQEVSLGIQKRYLCFWNGLRLFLSGIHDIE